jgi:hypothetical protein
MEKLLALIYDEACSENVAGVFLRAANRNLENYYRKLGFEDFFYRNHFWYYREHLLSKKAKPENSIHFISPAGYHKKRVHRLENHCSVNWDEDFFNFIYKTGTQFCEYKNSIFSLRTAFNAFIIDELLGAATHEEIAHLLFTHYPDIETVHIRSVGDETCCGQMKWCNVSAQKPPNGYSAFAME